jgi:hypothetical protein
VSSDLFNNRSSRFDDALVDQYRSILGSLEPLLPAEAAQAPVAVDDGQNRDLILAPGNFITMRGCRVERDAAGNVVAIYGEQLHAVFRIAEQLGWDRARIRVSDVLPTNEQEVRREAPLISPLAEFSVLKSTLLTFDHLLRGDPDRFTRNGWVAGVRDAIRATVLDGANYGNALWWHARGIQYEHRDEILAARRQVAGDGSPFEHVLAASGDPLTGNLDVAFVVASVDPYCFRLTRMWDGPPFSLVVASGMLRGTATVGPVVTDRLFDFSTRSLRCSFPPGRQATAELLTRAAREVGDARRDAIREAIDLVERRSDDEVRLGTIGATRFGEITPNIRPGDDLVSAGLERRLRLLFADRLEDPRNEVFFSGVVQRAVGNLSDAVRAERIARDDAIGAGVTWPAWIPAHREILDTLRPQLGLPGVVRGHAIRMEQR